MYREQRNYHNQQNAIFPGVGLFDIPQIRPEDADLDGARWEPFNRAKTIKDPEDVVIHCFVDDYQFERLWHNPGKYIEMLRKFRAVCSPDFSLYTDFPKAIQIYNHFRKHWLAKYYQDNGVTIIPTIGWSDTSSYDWCFDGEPRGGCRCYLGLRVHAHAGDERFILQRLRNDGRKT